MNGTTAPAATAAASTLGRGCRERHPTEETAGWEDPPRTRRSSAPLPQQPRAPSKYGLVWTHLVQGSCRRWFCHDGLGETSRRCWLVFVNTRVIILVPEEEENIANSNERTSPQAKRMTDHIAFLIDCARKGCAFLLEKELHTATKCQVVHLEERVRGGEVPGGVPFSQDIITQRTRMIPFSWDSRCTLCHHCMAWVGAWVSGVGGGQVWWVPWDPLSPWSRATAHCGLSFYARTYAPVPPLSLLSGTGYYFVYE